MSSARRTDAGRRPGRDLVVVHVHDRINQALTGHAGCFYKSPAQKREDALDLVRVLLGYTCQELNGATVWTCPVAGGRRTVPLEPRRDPTVGGNR